MHNCVLFSKHTKTVNNLIVTDPRFNIIAYTQPTTAANFAKKQHTDDGFFQRFLVTLPREVFVFSKDVGTCQEELAKESKTVSIQQIIGKFLT